MAIEIGKHHGGSFRVYMEHKSAKLGEQVPVSCSDIFSGCRVYVNGFTEPSLAELRALLPEHGGRVVQYWSRKSDITHIIAENLPANKIQEMLRLRDSTPVVSPKWIVACVEAGMRLPVNEFVLPPFRHLAPRHFVSTPVVPPASSALPIARTSPPDARLAPIPPMLPPPAPASSMTPPITSPTTAHSTETDDNFLQNFLKSSRLHFIGSWRAKARSLVQEELKRLASVGALPPALSNGVVVHVDLDCFFAAVSLLDHPHLVSKPVVVAHGSTGSEISSANYVARAFGIRAGMWMARAKELCPELVVLPYNFDRIRTVSADFFRILCSYSPQVQPMSCDEAYLLLPCSDTVLDTVSALRDEVFSTTGCTVSAGIGSNMLLAKVATRKAKPNGQFHVTTDIAQSYLDSLPASELPGVGWKAERVLTDHNITTVAELRAVSMHTLKTWLSASQAESLWRACRGVDDRILEAVSDELKPQKSIGVEVSWGVRLSDVAAVESFIRQLCAEAANRLAAGGAVAAHPALTKAACAQQITLKLKKRKPDSKPQKYLGHGPCDNLSRSLRLAVPVFAAVDIASTAIELYHRAGVAPADVRGVGVHLSELTFSEPVSSLPKPEKRARVSASPMPRTAQAPAVITPPDSRAMSSASELAAFADSMVESQPLETIREYLCELLRSKAADNHVSEAIQRAVQSYWGFTLHC